MWTHRMAGFAVRFLFTAVLSRDTVMWTQNGWLCRKVSVYSCPIAGHNVDTQNGWLCCKVSVDRCPIAGHGNVDTQNGWLCCKVSVDSCPIAGHGNVGTQNDWLCCKVSVDRCPIAGHGNVDTQNGLSFQPFKDQTCLFYIRTQCVPRSKHTAPRVHKTSLMVRDVTARL